MGGGGYGDQSNQHQLGFISFFWMLWYLLLVRGAEYLLEIGKPYLTRGVFQLKYDNLIQVGHEPVRSEKFSEKNWQTYPP